MKLLDITPLGEPNDSQFVLYICKEIKDIMKTKGYVKGTKLAIFARDEGFYMVDANTVKPEQKNR